MVIGSILLKQEWSVGDFEKLQLSSSLESQLSPTTRKKGAMKTHQQRSKSHEQFVEDASFILFRATRLE
jgi:hypothetical protein